MKALLESVDHLAVAMSFHRDRHAVLAGNVANVDTPGYKPFDLERIEASAAGPITLAQTASTHLRAPGGRGAHVRAFDDSGDSIGGDGNAVNLERELAKIDANRVRYNAISELVSRRLALLRYAATDGGG
jgi:flagellar basal-body rod protein FlgB